MRRKGHQRASGILAILLVIAMLLDSSSILMVLGAEPVPVESESMTQEETTATEAISVSEESEESEIVTESEEMTQEAQESAVDESETAATKTSLSGSVYLKKEKTDERTGFKGIRVYVFNQETYKEDDPQTKEREDAVNTILYEGTTKADGSYEIPDMQPGRYRIEYVNTDAKRDLTGYTAKLVKEDAKWQLNNTEDAGKYAYFAHVPMVEIEAATEISMVLEPKEQAEESESAAQETETKDTEASSEAPDTAGDMTIEDLKNADEEVAMAAQVTTETNGKKTRQASGKGWSFDVYYANEQNSYYTEKTQNFNLKYQVEFRNIVDIAKNTVEIRMPRALLTYRSGSKIYPADIAVPQGTPEDYTKMSDSSFNYYIDYETDELVFFNYEDIKNGTSAAFQVLYKNLKVMEIIDGTKWSLSPKITVSSEETDEEGETTTTSESETSDALTGLVNTAVNFTRVTKRPYTISGKSYAPGLYTKRQVKAYTGGSLPEKYEEHFEDYRYVVWDISVEGSATQPWQILLKERPEGGEPIGYSSESYKQVSSGAIDRISYQVKVVTAYPAENVEPGTKLVNTVDVIVRPADGIDSDIEKSATASWSYADYKWTYIGDNTYVSKRNQNGVEIYDMPGWLEVYRAAQIQDKEIQGFSFQTTGFSRGYNRTHQTSGLQIGEPLEGKSYTLTTVDDFLYAYPNNDPGEYVVLNQDDFYYSSVRVTQQDTGYDVWEDETATPEAAGDLEIWAYFKDSDDWERVDTVKWNNSGTMTYQFSKEEIARGPWRVKAVHNTTNYSTQCNIGVTVQIRKDSKALSQMMKDYPNMESLKIENISGILGEVLDGDDVTSYFHSQSTSGGNYSEPDLEKFTQEMYGLLLQRDNAYVRLLGESKRAAAGKAGTVANDPKNGRVAVSYRVTALDGYQLYGTEAMEILKAAGVDSPGRNEVVFYDLLPYGVQFDPSVPIVAGRTSSLNSVPGSWDRTQVKATVDTATDIIPNYKNSGRMMVIIHVSYAGVDSAVYANDMWMEGWGVSFGAYYVWKDQGLVNRVPNVAAFMPAVGDNRPLVGKDSEVAADNGTVIPAELAGDCKDFGSDINGDGITDVRNVMYAKATIYDDIAMAAKTSITKLVRADADKYGSYLPSGEVEKGKGYTYDLTVTNSLSSTMENIVIFDQLENGAENGVDSWRGTFAGIDTKGMESLGIKPVIYYNADVNAKITAEDGSNTPQDILTKANGWFLESEWVDGLEAVGAIAVDISNKSDGSKFQLTSMGRVKLQVHMTAPEEADEDLLAYNKGAYYFEETILGQVLKTTIEGEPAKVRLSEPGGLEVIKAFEGNVPSSVEKWSFQFKIYKKDGDEKVSYANKEYNLYKLTGGEWKRQEGVYGTNAKGEFYLKADEKAIFYDALGISELIVEEEDNLYWKQTIEETESGESRILLFKNKYRSPLYLTKVLQSVPEAKEGEMAEEIFTFQAYADGKVLANTEFWYVDRVRTDGGIPTKLGSGITDGEGQFTIKKGEIIALLVEATNVTYEVKEVTGYGDDTNWICENPTVKGNLPFRGTSASITNIYKWKSLYLTKEITHQKAADVTQEFTFQVRDGEGKPITDRNHYVVMENGADTAEGYLDDNGYFTNACAGKTIRIEGLEAKKTYQIVETDSGELYQAVNGGEITVTMPTYALTEKATITNDYLKRPLSVMKQVVYEPANMTEEAMKDLEEKEFTMTVLVEDKPLASHPYQVMNGGVVTREGVTEDDGSFLIKNGEKVILNEAGVLGNTFSIVETQDKDYPQLYPADEKAHQGKIQGEGAEVTFVNGRVEGALFLNKEYIGSGDAGKAYAEQLRSSEAKREAAAVSMTLEISEAADTYTWPKEDTQVILIDLLNGGRVKNETWKAGAAFKVQPWTMVMVSGMEDNWKYMLNESKEDQNRIVSFESKWLEVYQSNAPVKGAVKEAPIASIYNEVKEIDFEGNEISKKMSRESNTVAEGASLVWRVEKYDGTVWQPAEAVGYVTFAGNQVTCNKVLKTGNDGRIKLLKSDEGYPSVRFTEAEARLNIVATDEVKAGDFRVVELLEESDDEWGYLAGYGKEDGTYSLATSSAEAVSFVNANHYMSFEIEKQMTRASKEEFTMILKLVTSVSSQPIAETADILESESIAGISYSIYESENAQWIRDGATTKRGEIILQAGQYAVVDLPEGSMWTVSEQIRQPYTLEEMRKGGDTENLTKLEENLMLIYQAEPDLLYEGISISSGMVSSGVMTPSGQKVVLNQGNVVIPQTILYNGELRTVTGISNSAFSNNTSITGITFPKTLKTIDDYAFYCCSALSGDLIIPDSVTYIGVAAFEHGYGFNGRLILGNSLKFIGQSAFHDCGGFTGDLVLPASLKEVQNWGFWQAGFDGKLVMKGQLTAYRGVTMFAGCGFKELETYDVVLGWQMFQGCTRLEKVTIHEGMTHISRTALIGCANLKEVVIPSSMETIEINAFSSCVNLETISIDKTKNGITGAPWGAPETTTITWLR